MTDATYEDAAVEPGTLYYYWVKATNSVCESAMSEAETGFSALAAPTGVTATKTSGADAVTVTWQPVAGAQYYIVYRGTKSGEDYAVELDTTEETSYTDETCVSGRTYYYSVKAVGESCESELSDFVAGNR